MDLVTVAFFIFLGLMGFWYVKYAKNSQSKAIESNDKLTESNKQLIEAVNHLSEIIGKKSN